MTHRYSDFHGFPLRSRRNDAAFAPAGRIALAALAFAFAAGCGQPVSESEDAPSEPRAKVEAPTDASGRDKTPEVRQVSVSKERVDGFCGACHAYPPPETFPAHAWEREVERGFQFFEDADSDLQPPDIQAVVRYYEDRAAEELPVLEPTDPEAPRPAAFERRSVFGAEPEWLPALSFLEFVDLNGDGAEDELMICDMALGTIAVGRDIDRLEPVWTILSRQVANPARATVVDLNRDEQNDLLVANLGTPLPSDSREGQVVWLEAEEDGGFRHHVLRTGLGRVADVRAGDFDQDGDLDLVVAVFGWQRLGEILLLENEGFTASGLPTFSDRVLDPRHGAIHVPVVDLDGDGRLDIVALISQEYEAVVAYMNRGEEGFEAVTLFEGPHPAFGSSGIEAVDLDGDDDLDVLLTNGDVYDGPEIKPYHGVSWLENQGSLSFEHHDLGNLYGAHRAVAADFDDDGDLDIVASSFLAAPNFEEQRRAVHADALVLFEQTEPGAFRRSVLQSVQCDYPCVAVGDVTGNGRLDILAGRFLAFGSMLKRLPPPVVEPTPSIHLWENRGPEEVAAEEE